MYLFLASASEQEDLAVTIDVSYSKPSDFSLDPPNYRAGSSITLTCRVEGVVDGLTYSWSSTCTHNCFVRGKTTRSVTRHGLHSVDSGTHTCNVTDALGCTGNATIDMNVMGKNHMHLMTVIGHEYKFCMYLQVVSRFFDWYIATFLLVKMLLS